MGKIIMIKKSITRRELLKVLVAAGGGITAAAFLPAKWVKPVVQSGVLPVHAQTSGLGRIYGTGANPGATVDFYVESDTMKTGLKVAKPISPKMRQYSSGDYTTAADNDGNYSKDLPPNTYSVGSQGCRVGGNATPNHYQLSAGQSIQVPINLEDCPN
jgi:hypothetical protein